MKLRKYHVTGHFGMGAMNLVVSVRLWPLLQTKALAGLDFSSRIVEFEKHPTWDQMMMSPSFDFWGVVKTTKDM